MFCTILSGVIEFRQIKLCFCLLIYNLMLSLKKNCRFVINCFLAFTSTLFWSNLFFGIFQRYWKVLWIFGKTYRKMNRQVAIFVSVKILMSRTWDFFDNCFFISRPNSSIFLHFSNHKLLLCFCFGENHDFFFTRR